MRLGKVHPNWLRLLRGVLLVRCALDLVFLWRIQRVASPSTVDLADAFAPFALFDGIAAFAVAIVAFVAWLPRGIVVLAATDAIIRLAAANALYFAPGIYYFPMTIALFVGLLAASTLAFGVAEMVEAREVAQELGRSRLSMELRIVGIVTVLLAAAQFALLHVVDSFEYLLTIGIALQAVTMLAVAMAAQRASIPAALGGSHKDCP